MILVPAIPSQWVQTLSVFVMLFGQPWNTFHQWSRSMQPTRLIGAMGCANWSVPARKRLGLEPYSGPGICLSRDVAMTSLSVPRF